ncbi:MAG: signaling protein [Planctomycetaceae bacterium]|nr:signaling protein [Planctomycetaceae bacterium]
MPNWSALSFVLLAFVTCPILLEAADREEALRIDRDRIRLRTDLKDENGTGTDIWIYNDIETAKKIARKENKPIFVTFRCVPCKACMGFDAEVAKGNERVHQLARQKFVSVRQVEMKGVDLSLFEFDFDLNWAAMFINADGAVYARYGTQSADGPESFNSMVGLEKTMERVLKLHAGYPANATELKGKLPKRKNYKTALEMPGMINKSKLKGTTSRRNCIHCHMIHDAQNMSAQESGKYTQEMLWRYPLPDNFGLSIDARDGAKIKSVKRGSAADKAGLKTGQSVTHVNGQAIASIADIQWVLHHLSYGDDTVKIRTTKGEQTVALTKGWKKSDISWRGSMWSISPKLRVWMPPVTAADRRKNRLPEDQGALIVKWINTGSAGGRAARNSGLRQGDIVIALEGKPMKMTHRHFNLHIKLNYKIGEELPITVLRNGQRKNLSIKLVE